LKFLHARAGRWVFALETCRRGAKTYWESFDWWDLRGILRVPAYDIERLIIPKVPQNLRPAFCMAFGFHIPAFGVLEYCFHPLKHRINLKDLMRKPSPEASGAGCETDQAVQAKTRKASETLLGAEAEKENVQPNKVATPDPQIYVFEDLGEEYCEASPQESDMTIIPARNNKAYVV
jgi:hypothetical protein